MLYKWKNRYEKGGVSAETFAKCIDAIAKKNNGSVLAEQIVDAARPKTSPIHRMFEWDDSVAAERYRRDQAAGHLRALVEIHSAPGSGEDIETRAFVSVEKDEARSYRAVAAVMSDDELRRQLLEEALESLDELEAKYKHLNELSEVFVAKRRVRRAIAPKSVRAAA